MLINFGDIVPFSTVDYPGKLSLVIFLRGCNNNCEYCQNKNLRCGNNFIKFDKLIRVVDKNLNNFINAIVISGGEPLDQKNAIIKISKYYRGKGYKIGLHTSGKGKSKLYEVVENFDFILLAPPEKDKYVVN